MRPPSDAGRDIRTVWQSVEVVLSGLSVSNHDHPHPSPHKGLPECVPWTKLEIPFGHAFDRREVSSSKSAVCAGVPSVSDQPSRSTPYSGCRAA